MSAKASHWGRRGVKNAYPTEAAAAAAIARRMAEVTRHDGRPWGRMAYYQCGCPCGQWYLTTTAVLGSNRGRGVEGWLLLNMVDEIELGRRAAALLRAENRSPRRVAGLTALRRRLERAA